MNTRASITSIAFLMASSFSALAGGTNGSGLLVLNGSADGALTMSGNASIEIPARLVHVNSSSRNAIQTVGRAVLDAPVLSIVGGASFGGQSGCTGSVRTGVPAAHDPMYGRRMPAESALQQREFSDATSSNGTLTLEPGIYPEGIRITGNSAVRFMPGEYIIRGGGLVITSGSVSGEGVCIVVEEGECKLAGASSMQLSPPEDGDMQGVVLVQPRENQREMHLAGGSEFFVTGTIYAPSAELTMVGNSELEGEGPRMGDLVIADRVTLRGTSLIKIGDENMPKVRFPSLPVYD